MTGNENSQTDVVHMRVNALTQGWREIPWPFAELIVMQDKIVVESHFPHWWSAGAAACRSDIKAIVAKKIFGGLSLEVRFEENRQAWKIGVGTSTRKLLNALEANTYPVVHASIFRR